MAKAYPVRRQAGGPPDTDRPPLTPAALARRGARILHRLISELTMLATATTVTKRRVPDGAPQTSPLFEEAGLSAANDG